MYLLQIEVNTIIEPLRALTTFAWRILLIKHVFYITHYKSMKFLAFVQCIIVRVLLCGSAVLLASWRYMISVHEQPAMTRMKMINFAVTFDDIMICTCL